MSFLDDEKPVNTGNQHALSSFVSNGEVQGKGRSSKVDFLVTTKFANDAESLVRRTWEDFEWVQERLVEERAGIIVPVLPVKKPPSRRAEFEVPFIQERQEALDRFMQRIIRHGGLVDAPCLLPFFTANVTDWAAAKEAARLKDLADIEAKNDSSVNDNDEEAANTVVISATAEVAPQRKKGVFGQWWSAKRDQIALRSKNLILEETPVESKRFEDMQSYADHLESCIQILTEDSKGLGETQRNASEKYKTIGAAFTQLWGEHELSNTSSSTMYQCLGDCWANLSKTMEQQASVGGSELEEPLDELALDVAALREALAKRKKVVYEYTKLVQEGRKMQQRMDNMQSMTDMNQASDVYFALEREMRVMDATIEERGRFKDIITERLTTDIERFRVEWHERMRQVMEMYQKEQARIQSEQHQIWQRSLPVLSKIDDARSALPTGAKKAEAPELTVSYTTSGATVAFVGNTNGVSDSHLAYMVPLESEPDAAAPISVESEGDGMSAKSGSFDSVALVEETGEIAPPPVAPPPPPSSPPPPVPPSDSHESSEPQIASL